MVMPILGAILTAVVNDATDGGVVKSMMEGARLTADVVEEITDYPANVINRIPEDLKDAAADNGFYMGPAIDSDQISELFNDAASDIKKEEQPTMEQEPADTLPRPSYKL